MTWLAAISNFFKAILAFAPSQKMKEQRFQEKAPLRKDKVSRKLWKRERNRLRKIINGFELPRKLRRQAKELLDTLRVLPTDIAEGENHIILLYQKDKSPDLLKFIFAKEGLEGVTHSKMLILIDEFTDN